MPKLRPERISFFDTAPTLIMIKAKLSVDPAAVWDAFVDTPSWTEWFPGCTDCVDTSERTGVVGSTRRITLSRLKLDEEFLVMDPKECWAFTVTQTNLLMASALAERAEFEALEEGGTDLTYTVALEVPLVLRPLAPVIAKRIKTLFERGLRNLETYLTTDE